MDTGSKPMSRQDFPYFQKSKKILFDLDEGFGNFLNCTRRKESFETESALEPGNFRTNA